MIDQDRTSIFNDAVRFLYPLKAFQIKHLIILKRVVVNESWLILLNDKIGVGCFIHFFFIFWPVEQDTSKPATHTCCSLKKTFIIFLVVFNKSAVYE